MTDVFGRALLDHHRDERTSPLLQRDGEEVLEHPIDDFYFGPFADQPDAAWLERRLDGPLVDLGAGAGRDARHFQSRFETVAVEVSDPLVTLLDERGVERVHQGDMFDLPEAFERDRFRSVLCVGTQLGLARSIRGVTAFLDDLAAVTTAEAVAVVDAYDPTVDEAAEMLGYRDDSTSGLAFRVMQFEYDDRVGDTLLFRLFDPDRLREAAGPTPWAVDEVRRPTSAYYYRAALTKG